MKKMSRKMKVMFKIFFVLGIVCTTLPSLTKVYMPMPDFMSGLINGIGIGSMIVILMAIEKQKKKEINI